MEPLQRVTAPTCDVLRILVNTREPIWGLRIIAATGRGAGTIYPIMERLERSGWVTSSWDDDAARPGPRRRLYALTEDGSGAAQAVLAARGAARPVGQVTPRAVTA